jgi:hypothetical protein
MLEIFFIVCLEIALLAAAFLYVYNFLKKGMLNDSAPIRHAKLEELQKMPTINQEPPSSELVEVITPTPMALECS